MQSVQQYYNNVNAFFEQSKNELRNFFSSPLFLDMCEALSIIVVFTNQLFWQFINKSILFINITYDLCKYYIPIVYKFLYAFIEAFNNNYDDDDTNDVDNTNIPSPKKPIIDSSWCNLDIKNIIPESDVILENNIVNENNENSTDDVGADEVYVIPEFDLDSQADSVENNIVLDDTKHENNEIEINEDKKNQ